MFCPECGRPSDPGDSYCAACGARLPEERDPAPAELDRQSSNGPLGRLIGRSRRERLITLGTAFLLTLAAGALAVVLINGVNDDGGSVAAADRSCLTAKQGIAEVGNRLSDSRRGTSESLALYGGALAQLASDLRSQLRGGSFGGQGELETEIAGLERAGARAAQLLPANPGELGDVRSELFSALARVQASIEAADLDRCAEGEPDLGHLAFP